MDQKVEPGRPIADEILEVIFQEGMVDRAKLTPEATLESLGVESIDLVMTLLTLEERFGVYIPLDGELVEAKNLQAFVESIARRVVTEREKRAG